MAAMAALLVTYLVMNDIVAAEELIIARPGRIE